MSNFVALGDQGFMIDVLCSPGDLQAIATFAAKVPKLRIVIDHVGGLQIDGKAPPSAWVSGMQSAAAQPNVYCKVSNLVESTGAMNGDAPSDVAFYRPVLDALWAAFGEDRLVFGSNWPVSSPAAPLSTVVSIVKTYFMEKGKGASRQVFLPKRQAAYRSLGEIYFVNFTSSMQRSKSIPLSTANARLMRFLGSIVVWPGAW